MTRAVTTSAPGKLVLSGEYAVLDGAPAIAMAIDRRANVSLDGTDAEVNQVIAPGYSATTGLFATPPGSIRWLQGEVEYRLVDAVWRAAFPVVDGPFRLTLDSAAFFDSRSGVKTGLGSSAALTVALCAALYGEDNYAKLAHQAHLMMQKGVGSGVDIACSIHGGLIEYRRDRKAARTLTWPSGLHYRILWSGSAARTEDKLAAFSAESGSAGNSAARARLVDAAERMAAIWQDGHAENIVAGYQQYIASLRAFSDELNLDIFAAGHAILSDIAAAQGLAYKPCGAGGGDVGIVLGTDRRAVNAFATDAGTEFTLLDCRLDHEGMRIENIRGER